MKKAFSIFNVAFVVFAIIHLCSCDPCKNCPQPTPCTEPGTGEILVDTTLNTDTPKTAETKLALTTQWSVTVVVYRINALNQKVYVNNAKVSLPCSMKEDQYTNGSGATTFHFGDDTLPCECLGDSVLASKNSYKGGNVVSACGSVTEVKIE